MEIFSPKTIAALRWLLPKLARVVTPLIAFVITPLAALVVVENWRGNRAWRAVQEDLKARGEPLEWPAYQPHPIPDDRNFFKAQAPASMLGLFGQGSPHAAQFLKDVHLDRFFDTHVSPESSDWSVLVTDLKKIGVLPKDYAGSPAAGVLLALQPAKPFLDELREAARERSEAAPPPMKDPSGYFSNLSTAVFQPVRALSVRARAELELGRNDEAFADIDALTCITKHLTARPTLSLCLLLANATQGLAVGAINDGCRRHAWNEVQLAEFQMQLGRYDVFDRFRECVRTEQVIFSYVLDTAPLPKRIDPNPRPWWLFHGWIQQNKVAWAHHLDRDLLPTVAAHPDRLFLEKVSLLRQTANAAQASVSPYEWVSRISLPHHGDLLIALGRHVATVQQSVVFCALERHRLANGNYPDRLAELVPRFLPTIPLDVFDGQPLRYANTPPNGHRVYSVGQNGRDNGGKDDDLVLQLPDLAP